MCPTRSLFREQQARARHERGRTRLVRGRSARPVDRDARVLPQSASAGGVKATERWGTTVSCSSTTTGGGPCCEAQTTTPGCCYRLIGLVAEPHPPWPVVAAASRASCRGVAAYDRVGRRFVFELEVGRCHRRVIAIPTGSRPASIS